MGSIRPDRSQSQDRHGRDPLVGGVRGGGHDNLTRVLDPKVANATRKAALARLQTMQLPNGGFSWFEGMPASTYMTVYLMAGFGKALEFGVDVPKPMAVNAWRFLAEKHVPDLKRCMKKVGCWSSVTFLNYVLSMYPDASWYGHRISAEDRKLMLEYSFKHWQSYGPMLKAYLALTLKRMNRLKDARLVWESVLDGAKETENEGTYWAPEDRSWLWYNDTIESHAMAIRTTMELKPDTPKLDGMVLWLFLNKKLNHWKSTRATAEAIYALASYLRSTNQLGLREETRVEWAGQVKRYVFEPDELRVRKTNG